MTTAALVAKYTLVLASLADATSVVYNSVEAKKVTDDAGMDIGADIAGLMLFGQGLSTPSQRQHCVDGAALTSYQTQMCFAIVYGTVDLMTALEFLNGWGDPDAGKKFTDGQANLGNVDQILTGAYPEWDKWFGDAADAYAAGNQDLEDLAGQMAAADAAVANIVQRQAGQVQDVREQLAATKLSLAGVLLLVATISGNYFAYTKDVGGNAQTAGALAGQVAADAEEDVNKAKIAGKNAYLAERGITPEGWASMQAWQQWLDGWLPLIVLPPCIAAVSAATVMLGLLMADGDSNAGDFASQADAYTTVRRGAAAISDGSATPAVGMRAGSGSRVPGFWELPRASDTSGRSQRIAAGVVGDRGSDGALSAAGDDHWAGWFAAPASAARRAEAPLFATAGRVGSGRPGADASDAAAPDADADAGAVAGARHAYGVPMSFAAVRPEPAPVAPWVERNL